MVKLNENAVREAAYYNWQNAGCPQGQDEYFWNMALAQLSNCTCNKNSSCKSSSNTAKKTSSTAKKSLTTKASSTKTASKKSK